MNKFTPILSILMLLLLSQKSLAQGQLRFSGGLGTNKDITYNFAVDLSFNFLEESSKFNLGSNIGIYYYDFDEPLLATKDLYFYHLGLHFEYRILERLSVSTEVGSRNPFNDDNYNFNDPSGNPVPNSDLDSHIYLTPSLDCRINKTLGVFLFYNVAFEDRLDMNTIGIGVSLNY